MEVVKRKPSAEGWPGEKVLPAQKGSSLFRDNLEYLEVLAFEAKVWLAVANLRKKNSSPPVSQGKDSHNPQGDESNVPEKKDFLFPDLFPGEVTLSQGD